MKEVYMLQEALRGNTMGAVGAVVAFVIILFIVRNIITTIEVFFARNAALRSPTYENAKKVYRLYSRWGYTINNHPRDWAKVREMFNAINHSELVPTELKEKLKKRLIKKGLYINNMRIIDNYKGV